MKDLVTRFAPSPTGRLHLGHAYSALLAYRLAREGDGMFLLRIEDIDPGRTRSAHIDGIIEDMLWLGIEPDGEIIYQSERMAIYAEALERLKGEGLLYPCFCTRSEILAEVAASSAAPHGPDGPLYPGTCRQLSRQEREERMEVQPHAWRMDIAAAVACSGPLHWRDHREKVQAEPELFGDVVLARKDAPTSYHLAVTVDDAAQNITHVVRGRDLFASTHVHRLLQALLDLPTPDYRHHPLLTDTEGRRLAKRSGAPTLADLRASGGDPEKLAADLLSGRLPAGYSPAED
jgi:glutamyl-Q tRNA(Asp) synthetase